MPTIMVDRLEFDDAAKTRKTSEGYLVAMPRVARTGIQVYKGSEVGKADRDSVRVYRPAEEVFKRGGAFDSLAHRPFTDDHPSVPVTASNWKDLAIGHSDGEVVRDGEFVRVPMILMDAGAIAKFEAGKAELSVGYTCDLKWEAGKDPDGQAYDAVQTNIRANHVAMVDRARGGHKLRIGDDGSLIAERSSGEGADSLRDDHQTGDHKMDVKKTTLTVDGVSCTMDEQTAQIVQRAQDAAKQALADATAQVAKLMADAKLTAEELAKLREEKKKELESKDAEIAALNKKLGDSVMTPEKIAALVKDRAETTGKAKTLLGDKAPANIDTLDTAEIKKIVVTSQLGDVAKDWDANAINVAFTTLSKDVKAPAASAATGVVDGGAVQQLQMAFNKPMPVTDATKAYDERNKRLQDAWKGPRKSA